jgi:CRISPR/Cas system CSM-associated protein Csm2 small subunit
VNDLHSDIFSGYEKKRKDGKRVEVYNERNTDVRSVFADKTSRKALKNVITAEEAENGKNKVKYKLSEIAGRVDKEVVKIEAEMKAAKNAEAEKKGPAKG